jgi:hypothetical protein
VTEALASGGLGMTPSLGTIGGLGTQAEVKSSE